MGLSLKELIQLQNKSLEEQIEFLNQNYPKINFKTALLKIDELKKNQDLNNTSQTFNLRRQENTINDLLLKINPSFYKILKEKGFIKE